MARAHHVAHARHDIWREGKLVIKRHKQGKHAGQDYEDRDHSQPSGKRDDLIVEKGCPYYWWQFKNGPKHYSTEAPRQSQLTQSEFLQNVYSMQEELEDLTASSLSDLDSQRDDLADRIEELADEQDEKRSNMPDQLQDSDTGQLLESRGEQLRDWANNLRNVEIDEDLEEGEKEQEKIDEALSELQSYGYEGE